MRRVPYARTFLNQALYIPSLHQIRHADVVHVFSASYWSFLISPVPAIVAAKLLRKPVVLHYHSGEAPDHLARWRRSVAPFLRMVDEIVVPSSWLQSVFQSHGYRARVVPNVIDTSAYQYRERAQLTPSLLSVRNLEHHYRVDTTLRAFALLKSRFPEATLSIAGYGSQEQRLRELTRELGVDGVRFLGRIEPRSLAAIYNDADIFVNASTVDNQPVSILEAFACGLPVVSTPTGDIAAMLRQGEAGVIVESDNASAMADAVGRLLENPGLSVRLTRRASEELPRYAWAGIREQWESVYAQATHV